MIDHKHRHFISLVIRISLFTVFLFLNLHAQSVVSKNGMVASAHPLASEAGIKILKAGGNAIDAAVATAFTLAIVEPNASGLGGGGYVVYYLNGGNPQFMDYRECAPASVNRQAFYRDKETFERKTSKNGSATGVPGMVSGLLHLQSRHGRLPLEQVLEPAITLAESGFQISDHLAEIILQKYDIISENSEASQIYLADLLPPAAGTRIRNQDLAGTMRTLVTGGSEVFYHGPISEEIVQAVQRNGGYLSVSDMQNYAPRESPPVSGTYRGFQILSAAPSSGGGVHLIELLNILEQFDLRSLKHNSAAYIHLLAEALKIVLADKEYYMADPAFKDIPINKLISKEYAASLHERIRTDQARFDYSPSQMEGDPSGSTTHLSVVDSDRNCVALTQSINFWFGNGIVAGKTGVLLNNHLADFDADSAAANSLEPGKRPVSSIAPTIVLKDGKPVLVVGTPGASRIIAALAQIIINVVDFGMDVDEAIEAPRFHAIGSSLYLENRIPETIRTQLIDYGHKLQLKDAYDSYFGGAQAVYVDPENQNLHGGADSRRDGVAVGY